MNKVSLYIVLILIFLGLSKGFSPSSQGKPYVFNEQIFPTLIEGGPLTVVLVDSFEAGFLIKTYFQRYLIIHGFKSPETLVVRTSKSFYEKNLRNIGMSLFRRKDSMKKLSLTPMPPGSLFIGDPTYGKWVYENSGKRVWRFHRAYRHYPPLFRWEDWRPSFDFYKKIDIYEQSDKPYYGKKNEFGTNGTISMKGFPNYHSKEEFEKINFKNHMKKFIRIPSIKSSEDKS